MGGQKKSGITGFQAVQIVYYGRRKTLQGMNQLPVPFYFYVYLVYNVRERTAVTGEVMIPVRNLLQGVCQIKCEVLLLGVKDYGQLITILHEFHHLFLLDHAGCLNSLAGLGRAVICAPELDLQNSQGLSKIPFFKNGGNRFYDSEQQNKKQGYLKNFLHLEIDSILCKLQKKERFYLFP